MLTKIYSNAAGPIITAATTTVVVDDDDRAGGEHGQGPGRSFTCVCLHDFDTLCHAFPSRGRFESASSIYTFS